MAEPCIPSYLASVDIDSYASGVEVMIVELPPWWRAILPARGHTLYVRSNGPADPNPLVDMKALQYRFHVITTPRPPPGKQSSSAGAWVLKGFTAYSRN